MTIAKHVKLATIVLAVVILGLSFAGVFISASREWSLHYELKCVEHWLDEHPAGIRAAHCHDRWIGPGEDVP